LSVALRSLPEDETDDLQETIMAERDGYISGVPCWIDTSQPDPDAACSFYGALFGWEFEDAMAPGSAGKYFMARIRGGDVAAVGSIPGGAPTAAMWNTYIWVENADETAAKAEAAGGRVAMAAFDVMDAGRMAVLIDPEGAAFCIWQPNHHKGAKIVNEHGSLNFNTLATRDQAAAEAFYGAVFGWQTLVIPAGVMWTLPGYGDHLEEKTPGLREQMGQMGAPDGFIDVVAALNPIADGDSDSSAHWSVTFAVDDAAAVAAKARELGGQVVSGPLDAPWAKVAVINDPQGAGFIASQFVPENKDVTA
jgi:predicted enzyme related to lactoylglutathione lyase